MNIDVNHYIARWIAVYLDGNDITRNCFFAELADDPGVEVEGKVGIYPRDENNKYILVREYGEMPEVKQEYLSGRVLWRWQPDAPEDIKARYQALRVSA